MEERALPASVRGPVEWAALALLASCLAAEMVELLVPDCDSLDIGGSLSGCPDGGFPGLRVSRGAVGEVHRRFGCY